jgi:D-3-phosphoglycerate dehydrogenase
MPSAGLIAVTPRSLSEAGHPSLGRLEAAGFQLVFPAPGRTPTATELEAVLPRCIGYLAGVEPVPAGLLQQCPGLRVISRNGVGVDNVDLDAASQLGIAVVPALGANSQGVAELALALAFAAARMIPWSDARLKTERWQRIRGIELAGRTLGVIGLGQIGRRVAAMAAGIGMRVIGQDACPDQAWRAPAGFEWTGIEAVLAESDVVSLHAPGGPRPLVGRSELARMRAGTILVNTARASLVDPAAVLDALDSGQLHAYCIDAHDTEPPTDFTLIGHERVIATPHVGGLTEESVDRASAAAVEGLLRALSADVR